MYFLKLFCVLSVALLLGCKQQHYSHLYLMQHPETLGAEVHKCKGKIDDSYCDMVSQAQTDFVSLAAVREHNQLAFGEQIIRSEQELANAAPATYQEKLDKVRVLLAVVKATS